MSAATWEPGDPLHEPGSWTRPIFELIEEKHLPNCPMDAASWPIPRPWDDLGADV